MNFIAEIHGYPPYHNSGAEWMAHHIFRHLIKEGHEVTVLLNMNSYLGGVPAAYEFEGVKVISDVDFNEYYAKADAVFTHLDKTGRAYNRARMYRKPLVHLIHNDYSNVIPEKMNAINQYAVYNTFWVKEKVKDIQKMISKSIVVHPPVYVKDYRVKRINDYITLINLNHNKGGDFLIELAKRMPERKFMGVMGSYGHQVINYKQKNIHYVENGDISRVYKRTRILLMPSIYESYGRTAIEACSSGIPVICTPTPGLQEALGEAGIYIEKNIELWVSKIKQLDNEKAYKMHSELSADRAKEVNPENELKQLTKFLENEVHRN